MTSSTITETSAGPAGSDFARLSARVAAAGLMRRPPGYYLARFLLVGTLAPATATRPRGGPGGERLPPPVRARGGRGPDAPPPRLLRGPLPPGGNLRRGHRHRLPPARRLAVAAGRGSGRRRAVRPDRAARPRRR